ncbi:MULTISPECIES: hypothetical protein [Bradyrhizobium]|uniref:Uncharacterized protein n=1 Tax=Bradyrhizobium elkanii TaxID=29448 RepID=A0A8I1YJR7_BRAEL|nr:MULTISPECIES: hypothetical protein [Bradyrhizobium]MBP1299336.1 hypothetical protein [Bradyrhizobium elkanii]MCP1929806.1 hypothetical protein [Bradyrhizobium elkanii]MCS3481937.1 hypothetical protein [Bradyrhizobium elkanii]MCS3579579.1 hypothetical protein [Bradyrhizobium elkanii]MCS3722450.1 hypothetical protein [Bradyrhizobium elkanii]
MDTVGVIMAVAAIATVGDAAIIMAGTGAITTVGAIITATGGDVLIEKREAAAICDPFHVRDLVTTASHPRRHAN